MSLGWIYALSYRCYAENLEEFLVRGHELKDYIANYFTQIFNQYPGLFLRKLFYTNTLLKQSSLIFLESYYASQGLGVEVRHPLMSLSSYKAAFSLADEHKYRYPNGKLALIALYKDHLPKVTIERKKSGTQLPLSSYLYYWADRDTLIQQIERLKEIPFLREKLIDDTLSSLDNQESLFLHLLVTLSVWLSSLPNG